MFSELYVGHRRFIKIWLALIAVIFLLLGWLAVHIILVEKQSSVQSHLLRMGATTVEPGKTQPDPLPANADFTPVNIGIYLDGIENVSIKDSYWTATFYVWFRWKGDKSLEPGRTFQIIDAKMEKKELLETYVGADGINYQNYKVVARMTKFFNTTRVPLDDHMLNIYIEDASSNVSRLRYVADPATNISSRVKVPGYLITNIASVVKPHTYKTTYGDPRVAEGKRTTYSQYIFAVSIKQSTVGVYFKFFVGLFAGVILTLGSFFILPSDTGPRFALPSAAYFGAVANTYLVSTLMPSTGQFGLADLVTSIGLFTISLCVVASLTSGYYYLCRDEKEFSRHLDRASWVAIFVSYVGINILLPVVAFS